MKKNVLSLVIVFFIGVFNLFAQGIEFEHISLEEALKKAELENKLVFIDFYTTWCAPCKIMSKNVFPIPEVGALYNKEFVSIKLDAEKEGLEDAKKYQVNSYPTYLYLNSSGNVVYKESGSRMPEDFIQLGRDVAASVSSEYSLEKLQTIFINKQDDPDFLKIYYTKMMEYGQNPTEGINAWLKVQNEIEEDDVDMMEFLLKYKDYIILNSKGAEILKANFDEYMDIATRKEEEELEVFKEVRLAKNTRDYAFETKNPELWLIFMEAFNELPEKYKKKGNYLEYKITYSGLLNDSQGYKKAVITYVDSLIADKTISEIKAKDQAIYEKRSKALEGNNTLQAESMLKAYKNGINSGNIVEDLHQKGEAYLKYVDSKKEYKNLENWIEYGYNLEASAYYMDDLTADMYYKKGKAKKAIECKERALANWPEDDKKFAAKKYELEQMKKGASI
ncbi:MULTISPECIES: DUF255 domain-containing protein [Mangrovimonas]|uniref:thioredoxin family protein n=1 Tax=Mangrovimonas TaxID=1211036 RepID=UPI0006B4B4BB|nr:MULTISPECIES: DUF255 domain-containing protein [Mangrovimonas]OMP30153.1 hypothetical protein BKM32_12245 [Mangrovimonas sp. DI 80]